MKLPALFIDVDGVLKMGYKPIQNAKKGIEIIQKLKIPFKILTNDGGDTEKEKALKYSKILQLKKPFSPNDIVLCHSPMKQQLQIFSKKDMFKVPLIVGQGNIPSLMNYYGVKKYITCEEYALIYYKMLPINIIKEILYKREQAVKKVKQRLKVSNLFPPIAINGIFQISDVLRWEIPVQLCSDLLISSNGIPGTKKRREDKFSVSYHLSFDEIQYKDSFVLPRFSGGACFQSLQHLFKLLYKYDFPYTIYVKPSKLIFNYAKEKTVKNYPYILISNYYMIGDNPEIDIKGANECGIHSILVSTGVFDHKKNKNDSKYPAKVVVKDFYEAINYILLRENII